VAIARALANNPPILIADEPTGNLDSATGTRIFDLLHALSRTGKLVIFVTHDPELAQQATRIITVQDGQVVSDTSEVRPASSFEIEHLR
jgi:putative ABC transport system ATP-binding protein